MADCANRTAAVLFLSDVANKGAKYGVQDDDYNVINEFLAEGINVDLRFSMWSERRHAEGDTMNLTVLDGALPGCHFGRLGF